MSGFLLKSGIALTISQVFLNVVLDEAVEEKPGGERVRLGMVVIRGNSVVMLEVCFIATALMFCSIFRG